MTLLSAILLLLAPLADADSVATHHMDAVTVSAPLKHTGSFLEQPVAFSSFTWSELDTKRIIEPKGLSLAVPNLMYADYGSKMTSSIYIRGIGSRMDQPAMGLYVDNVPVLNKNNYDFDYFDVRRIDVLRGPQGTLYGRNTIGGIIDVQTISPFDYQGTMLRIGYGNGNSSELRASTYYRPTDKWAFSLALSNIYSDGFFINRYDGSSADRILSQGVRAKVQRVLSNRWTVDNSVYFNRVKQRGFAYAFYDPATGSRGEIDHNDPCTYDRIGLMYGLTFRYEGERVILSSTTSYQYTDDDMRLDQDFRPMSMFTLRQAQKENAVTQEFVARSTDRRRWQWITGLFGFYKHVDMKAPVVFKRDGIDRLIIANANEGIHTVFPDADLLIEEQEFTIDSYFQMPAYGLSLYHQSTWDVGRWRFTGGIRADFEHSAITYNNNAQVHYRFSMTMPQFKALPVEMRGQRNKSYFEFMPRVAVTYRMGAGNIYATVSRGYKAGGYNTQIFSDILQNKMMNEMMSDLGLYFDGYDPSYDPGKAISYDPEYSLNYEIGAHLNLLGQRLLMDAALFYIDCRDQQLTVFPAGQSTGRLMSNAGRTRSFGAEITVNYQVGDLRVNAGYGYTNARFMDYDNGNEDYSGNYVPYAPLNTVSVSGGYNVRISRPWADLVTVHASWQAAGRIYWNEENSVSQPFYSLLNASVAWKRKNLTAGLWAKNLTGSRYDTFYFKSVGNSFVQRGKPIHFGIFINLTL